jgi:hypothetical protein
MRTVAQHVSRYATLEVLHYLGVPSPRPHVTRRGRGDVAPPSSPRTGVLRTIPRCAQRGTTRAEGIDVCLHPRIASTAPECEAMNTLTTAVGIYVVLAATAIVPVAAQKTIDPQTTSTTLLPSSAISRKERKNVTVGGKVFTTGDVKTAVSIQSISKVFTMAQVNEEQELESSVLAVMAMARLYDDSGKRLYHTGLPAKSGVGGGLIAVSPGKFGIAVVSPPLDDAGNSVRAQRAIAAISKTPSGAIRWPQRHASGGRNV